MSDIPGFYYDEEKKKYFKILDNNYAGATGVVTQEKVSHIKAEKKRKIDVRNKGCLEEIEKNGKNIYNTIKTRQYNYHDSYQFYRQMFSSLDLNSALCLNFGLVYPKIKLSENEEMLALMNNKMDTSTVNAFEILSSDEDSFTHSFHKLHKNNRCFDMYLKPYNYEFHQYLVDMTFFTNEIVAVIGYSRSLQGKYFIFLNHVKREICQQYESKHKLNCVANLKDGMVVMGHEQGLSILNETDQLINKSLDCSVSSVSARKFDESNVFHLGTSRGQIGVYDMRCKRCIKDSLPHKYKNCFVTSMYSLSHYPSVLASLSCNKLVNYDMRNKKVIKEYSHHKCSFKQTPLHLDFEENFICSVGDDTYTRIWDVRKGDLLNSIAPPYCTHGEHKPASCFLPSNSFPGLFMAFKHNLNVYTF